MQLARLLFRQLDELAQLTQFVYTAQRLEVAPVYGQLLLAEDENCWLGTVYCVDAHRLNGQYE